ncbi:esterase family protein [Algisphaera agarilytica]|uniref:Esterase/lipase superfamily enzyme n=1 Tax=Algisphaera agarilytica TaxID=1385975 RepID=A0A7X0LK95_9BACT|nr:alpha/beta hydrolase-fold protein [Algisphaera agarilytica]MBB6429614.1 esterase/lipase superfamily enzyme [Algisphaera agarilytica]
MQREYHRWHSQALGRDMELLAFGHAGPRVLVFPTRVGRFFDYENWGLVGTLRPRIEAGQMQLFCLDSIDDEALYATWMNPADRMRRNRAYEEYVLREVMPLTRKLNPHIEMWAHGCSFGAYHAMTLALRQPQFFSRIISFSGRYDPTLNTGSFRDLLDGHYDDLVYHHAPSHFIPRLEDHERLEQLRKLDITIVIGREDAFLANNREFSEALHRKGIPHQYYEWDGEAHRAKFWRQMLAWYM